MSTELPFEGKHVLLLQGPHGPFFAQLAKTLKRSGAIVHKFNFTGGDCLFYPLGANIYRRGMKAWPAELESYLLEHQISDVFLFGDCRPIHEPVRAIATKLKIVTWVYEEGYLRPDYITLEKNGVNGFSSLPKDPEFYRAYANVDIPEAKPVGRSWFVAMIWSLLYYASSISMRPFFGGYKHHRDIYWLDFFREFFGLVKKGIFVVTEYRTLFKLIDRLEDKYFFVPLQVRNDAQVTHHSNYESIEEFISEVMISFSRYAPKETVLVFKNHPFERAYYSHKKFIDKLTVKHELEGRVVYVNDLYLPVLLRHTRGVVTINSTVGLSALHHYSPVKVCGNAIYDFEGLSYPQGLDRFWGDASKFEVDRQVFHGFRRYLLQYNQINGNFYRGFSGLGFKPSINWLPASNVIPLKSRTLGVESPNRSRSTSPCPAKEQNRNI